MYQTTLAPFPHLFEQFPLSWSLRSHYRFFAFIRSHQLRSRSGLGIKHADRFESQLVQSSLSFSNFDLLFLTLLNSRFFYICKFIAFVYIMGLLWDWTLRPKFLGFFNIRIPFCWIGELNILWWLDSIQSYSFLSAIYSQTIFKICWKKSPTTVRFNKVTNSMVLFSVFLGNSITCYY